MGKKSSTWKRAGSLTVRVRVVVTAVGVGVVVRVLITGGRAVVTAAVVVALFC